MRKDPLSKAQRSERMSRIKSSGTKPEMAVRRLTHGLGYRYRLSAKDLPGRPDLVFRSRRKVIFVHGCFWHQHGCGRYRMPLSRKGFWLPKLEKNTERDKSVMKELSTIGWKALTIWECELKDMSRVEKRIKRFLGE
ncbi:MAG: DNA mismatch endonuclease Vsr [Pseudomonadales bacterium]|nr:DNA mismatch endonuclease Vsr [Pseudomonadales bacterium]